MYNNNMIHMSSITSVLKKFFKGSFLEVVQKGFNELDAKMDNSEIILTDLKEIIATEVIEHIRGVVDVEIWQIPDELYGENSEWDYSKNHEINEIRAKRFCQSYIDYVMLAIQEYNNTHKLPLTLENNYIVIMGLTKNYVCSRLLLDECKTFNIYMHDENICPALRKEIIQDLEELFDLKKPE